MFDGPKASDAIEHTGFICLDFDKFKDLDDMALKMESLREDQYTFAVWLSPSARGFKLIVKIPKSLENHKFHFNALADYYSLDEWDKSTSDVSRHCFHSYDPDLFLNVESEVFTEMSGIIEEIDQTERPKITLKSNDQIIEKVLKWYEPKFDYNARNASLYILAAALNRYGVMQSEAVLVIKNNYGAVVGNDGKTLPENEIMKIVSNGYSDTAAHGTAHFEDKEVIKSVRHFMRLGRKPKEISDDLVSEGRSKDEVEEIIAVAKVERTEHEFWVSTVDKNGKEKLEIAPLKFKKFLADNGFYKYYRTDMDYIFIHISGRFVSETNEENIRSFVLSWAEKNNWKLFDHIAKDTAKFDKKFLNLLYEKHIDFIKDDNDSAKLFFRNKLIEVKKDEIIARDYIDYPEYVWKDQIIDRDFIVGDDKCDFNQFVKDLSGPDKEGRHDEKHYNEDRFNSFMSTLGYLMHTHKRLDRAPAVIFYDEKGSEAQVSGGTGKGLLYKAISEFKESITIDGKSFDSSREFAWQLVKTSTQFLMLDDIQRGFNFENIFSVITNGITVNPKNKSAFFISPEDSPKIVITSNYVLKGNGSSHERRRHEIELYNYYGSSHTPADRFGKLMFNGWTNDEWARFNNFMVKCLQYYLANGLVSYDYINIKSRRVATSVGDVLVEWANDYYSTDSRFGVSQKIKDLYHNFKSEVDEKWWSQKLFNNKLIELFSHWKEAGEISDYNFQSIAGANTVTLFKDEQSKIKTVEVVNDIPDLPF